jgi:hypothetical protein
MKFDLQQQESLTKENVLFETVLKIIRTCINAANCTLSIISALREQNLLGETIRPKFHSSTNLNMNA